MKGSFYLLMARLGLGTYLFGLVACNIADPTSIATPIPPTLTATTIPSSPTATPIPPSPTNTPVSPTFTSIPPTATATMAPTPTMEPLTGSVPEGIVVTFLGPNAGCTVEGPTEIPPGEITFVYRDLAKTTDSDFYVRYFTDGKTHQDWLEAQGKPGTYRPWQSWVVSAKPLNGWRNEYRREKYRTYSVVVGDHGVWTGSHGPVTHWFCGPLTVTGTP